MVQRLRTLCEYVLCWCLRLWNLRHDRSFSKYCREMIPIFWDRKSWMKDESLWKPLFLLIIFRASFGKISFFWSPFLWGLPGISVARLQRADELGRARSRPIREAAALRAFGLHIRLEAAIETHNLLEAAYVCIYIYTYNFIPIGIYMHIYLYSCIPIICSQKNFPSLCLVYRTPCTSLFQDGLCGCLSSKFSATRTLLQDNLAQHYIRCS